MKKYRSLLSAEKAQLERQGCYSGDWSKVMVAEGFIAERVRDARLFGEVRLGVFADNVSFGDLKKPSGVYHVSLSNVTIGDNCRVVDVPDYISNYDIADNAVVEHVSTLYTEGETAFGNGVHVCVLKEDGGRDVIMHEKLSAHNAYLQCMYRHDEELQHALQQMAETVCRVRTGQRGYIGKRARVCNCGKIGNVWIGDGCAIDGATLLYEGTLAGTAEAPAVIGAGVQARQFILLRGAKVDGAANIERCFVGEASHIGKAFTATDTLVFANCRLECGEACSLFAGPFTVSHHKSTLLIGVMTSFMNAGSGTNESNHSYKLGPIHYGVLERGCRTGSNCYLLWPSRIGMFSTILGDVKHRLDTHNLPFSYIIGEGGETYISPGSTLRSVGTWRDVDKWAKRDKRPMNAKHSDTIYSDVFIPAVAAQLIAGIHTLEELRTSQGLDAPNYNFQGATIKRSSLEKGLRLYTLAAQYIVGKYVFDKEVGLLDNLCARQSSSQTVETMGFNKLIGSFYWVDIAGAWFTESVLEEILIGLRTGTIITPEELQKAFSEADDNKSAWSQPSVSSMQSILTEERITTTETYLRALNVWQHSAEALLSEVIEDSKKEFAAVMKITSGIDVRDQVSREKDFVASGATLDNYPIVKDLKQQIEEIRQQVAQLTQV